MSYRWLMMVVMCLVVHGAAAQYVLSGSVLDGGTGRPVGYASVVLEEKGLWATTDDDGLFVLTRVPAGDVRLSVSCLGYVKATAVLRVSADSSGLRLYLVQESLALDEVVVTAKQRAGELATAYVIDRVALDHLQLTGAADILSLLPGGQTNRQLPHLAREEAQTMLLRADANASGMGVERGNAAFGTAVEVDGVRLSNNAFIGGRTPGVGVAGADVRSISPGNIESVEMITGIASAAYGDMTNGVVRINTRRGKSPWMVELKSNPNTKSASLGKGFGLGRHGGVLNVHADWTRSIADPASPYTAYGRHALSVRYDHTLNLQRGQPLAFTVGLTGNMGGYDTEADPDRFTGEYTSVNDHSLRAHTRWNYLLNLRWITSLEIDASAGYADRLREEKTGVSAPVSQAALHGRDEGYFISTVYDDNPGAPVVSIPPGHRYEVYRVDNRPLDLSTEVKARWAKSIGRVHNRVLLGGSFSRSGNAGRGRYYTDLRTAPSWREYRYDRLPALNNLALYAEDRADVRLGEATLQLMAGIRSDRTFIPGSAYGVVGSLSPRLNARYVFPETGVFRRWSVRAGYGRSVKLPSFALLYPEPTYSDEIVFASSVSGNEQFAAYHILPHLPRYNPELRWQYSRQLEAGIDVTVKDIAVSLTLYQSTTGNNYESLAGYDYYAYHDTPDDVIDNATFPIAPGHRQFDIDRATGAITVSDKTGAQGSVVLPRAEVHDFKTKSQPVNGSPTVRRGVEWVVDFGRVRALQTAIRWDGNYYYYRDVSETMTPWTESKLLDYVGFYPGGHSAGNGVVKKQLHSNITFTTHIPAIRLIVSLRIEGTLYHYTQPLSEYRGQPYGFAIAAPGEYFPSGTLSPDIYAGNQLVRKYPLYYAHRDDLNHLIPFTEAGLRDAYANNRPLYNQLVKLALMTTTNYYFTANRLSAYAFANIHLTKEIGDFAAISFQATNFLNSLQLIKSSENDSKRALYRTANVPYFYYGLSLKLKL